VILIKSSLLLQERERDAPGGIDTSFGHTAGDDGHSDDESGGEESVLEYDEGTGINREDIIGGIGSEIEHIDGRAIVRVQTKKAVWQSKIGLLDKRPMSQMS